uniref:Uncharacterized protein n=1 Tax=Cannabis sativa TaxID=3483 RepID=A0A803NT40_CANSA
MSNHGAHDTSSSQALALQYLVVPLSVVIQGLVPVTNYVHWATDWEAEDLHLLMRCVHDLGTIVDENEIMPYKTRVFHRLAQETETPNHNYGGFCVCLSLGHYRVYLDITFHK